MRGVTARCLPVVAVLLLSRAATPQAEQWPPPQPGDNLYVLQAAPNASDDNDGSRQRPWKTISRGVSSLAPGDTLWIGDGLYRESVRFDKSGTGFARMLSLRAMPGETPVISGAEPVSGWQRSPDEPDRAIYEAPWPWEHIFPGMIASDDQPLIPLNVPDETEALKPPAAYCQYFIGFGRGREKMVPGSFYFDQTRRMLLVWLKGDEDPNRHRIEAAVRGPWCSSGNFVFVEGLTIRYCPLVVPVGGVAFVMTGPGGGMSPAEGCIVRDCDISLSAFDGMVVRGGRRITTLVEDCWVHHNGEGCGSIEGQGEADSDSWLLVRRCRFTDNNLFNWNQSWHAGGKHFGTRVWFDQCEFARHHASPGVWFDIRTRDCIVNHCYSHDNGGFGLYYEIGETGAFVNSVVEGHVHCAAIGLIGSSRSLVAHNAVRASERGILVSGESRSEGRVSRTTCFNSVLNNVAIATDRPAITISPESDIATGNRSDHNLVWLSRSTAGAAQQPAFETWGAPALTLDQWRQDRGLGLSSRVLDPLAEISRGLFIPSASSPVREGGTPLDLDTLRAIFAIRQMPVPDEEIASSSVRDHLPASEEFLLQVAALVAPPESAPVPVGPLPDPGASLVQDIPIENSGFEAIPLARNATDPRIPGWEINGDVPLRPHVWHGDRTGLWNWYAPSPTNLLVLPAGETDLGVSQQLPTSLHPATRYRLSIWAGQRMDQAVLPWPRVTLSLHAGERLLKSVVIPEPKITPHHGVWVETALSYTAPFQATDAEPLRISLSRTGPARVHACFDDASLTATPVGNQRPPGQ